MGISIEVKTKVYPTEDLEIVKNCIYNLIKQKVKFEIEEIADFSILKTEQITNPEALKKIFYDIRNNKFLDTVRNCAIKENEQTLLLHIHKEALTVNKIAVITEDVSSPFGSIELRIKGKNAKELLDWLAPLTKDGKAVEEHRFSEIFSF